MTKLKEYKAEFKYIKEVFNLPFYGTIEKRNKIETKWGNYLFYFDKDSIFGKFENLNVDNFPKQFQRVKGETYRITHYPSKNGKMNFHYDSVFDFVDVIDRILLHDVA